MATTSGPFYSYLESQTTGLLKRSVDPIIQTIDPKFVPIREAFGYNGFTADALKVEYLERNDTPIIGSIGTAATQWNTTTEKTGLSVTDASVFCIYDVLLTADKEIVIVSDLDESADTIDVISRADCLSTESVTNEDADAIYIIGHAELEGYTYGISPRFELAAQKYNYIQLFHQDIEVTDIMEAISKYGPKSLYSDELAKKTLRVAKLLEQALIYGGPQAGNGSNPGTLCGLIGPGTETWQTNIQTNTTSVGGLLTESNILDEQQTVYEKGGHIDLIMLPPKQKRRFSTFRGAQRRYRSGDEKIGDVIDTYFSDFGVIDLIINEYLLESDVILLEKKNFKVGPLTTLGFHTGVLPETKAAKQGYVKGYYTSMHFNEEHAAYMYDLT